MSIYSVIVCPKCRQSAQLVEENGAKTTRCQRCGSTLNIRKLNKFNTSESVEEARAVRTKLQMQLSSQRDTKGITEFQHPTFGEIHNSATAPEYKIEFGKRKLKTEEEQRHEVTISASNSIHLKKKKIGEEISTFLLEKERGMEVSELYSKIKDKGFSEDIIKETLEKLKHSGQIYYPKKDWIKIIL